MKIDIKDIIQKYSLLFFFLIIFAFIFIAKINLKEIWDSVSSIKVWQIFILILGYFCLSGIFLLVRKYLLNTLGANVNLKNLALIHFSSLAAHYSTPAKIGFPITIYLLKKFEKVSYSSGTAMVSIEVIISTGMSGIIALIGAFQYFSDYIR